METRISISLAWFGIAFITAISLQNTNASAVNDQTNCWDFRGSKLDRGTKCGYRPLKMVTPHIMNGEDADLGEFPWMARLMYKSVNPNETWLDALCAGSIIHESFILSAAHCCEIDKVNLSLIRVGEYDTSKDIDCKGERCAPPYQDLEIEYYKKHSEYDGNVNDICLIKLKKPLTFTDYVFPICLPLYCDEHTNGFGNDRFLLAGWGLLDETNYPHILQKVSVSNVPMDICDTKRPRLDHAKQMCAGAEFGQDCSGDSGGPLMVTSAERPSRLFLVGIISYGDTCSLKNKDIYPGVYTRVSYYIPWILNYVK